MSTSDYERPREPVVDSAWLAKLRETALEPDLPIVDPHHHLWEHDGHSYLLDDFLADTNGGHNIVSSVFVQCGYAYRPGGPVALQPVGETERVVAIAEEADGREIKTRVCEGIAGYADLTLGECVAEVLEAQLDAAKGRFRGIRYIIANDPAVKKSVLPPPPALIANDAKFRNGFAQLAKFGLTFDAWLYHTQIAELTDLARAFPETPIVMDHFGGVLGFGPFRGRREEVFETWRKSIRELATCPNVHVKMGGFAMGMSGWDFHRQPLPPSSGELANAWRPYIESCIEAFGADRCMFESNFPADKGMCSYVTVWNAFKRVTSGASAEERDALFRGTAARFYRLQGASSG